MIHFFNIITIVAIVVLGPLVSARADKRSHSPSPVHSVIQKNIDSAIELRVGIATSSPELLLFFNPVCGPSRGFFQGIFPKLKEEYADTGKLHIRIVPLGLDGSKCEARFIHSLFCANEQGKFLDYLTPIMESPQAADPCQFDEFIVRGKLDKTHFYACQKAKKYMSAFVISNRYLKDLKIAYLPSEYMGGDLLESGTYEALKDDIEKHLHKN